MCDLCHGDVTISIKLFHIYKQEIPSEAAFLLIDNQIHLLCAMFFTALCKQCWLAECCYGMQYTVIL